MSLPGEHVLYREAGASWWWLAAGPVAAGLSLVAQFAVGLGLNPVVPVLFLVVVGGFVAIQIKAARVHTSVELTRDYLRQGTERLSVADIERVYPPVEDTGGDQPWQTARALGELSGVPKGRRGVGLRLAGGRTAQAWARSPVALRSALAAAIDETVR